MNALPLIRGQKHKIQLRNVTNASVVSTLLVAAWTLSVVDMTLSEGTKTSVVPKNK
jgi:hypothetical protein